MQYLAWRELGFNGTGGPAAPKHDLQGLRDYCGKAWRLGKEPIIKN